jgi:transcriptional regulator with XRE-family HTH domain
MRSPLHNEKYAFFLEELQALRARTGWSQRELAAELSVGQDLISRCESGKRRVDVCSSWRCGARRVAPRWKSS